MYRLTGRLEQSQLADLFRAERDGSEAVVIKLFHLKTSDAAYARVIGDVSRQLQPVSHAGIARVLDVGMVDGQLAIVRQDVGKYTLGLALQRLNTREVYLPPTLALALCLELLDAVSAAHAAGVVHGALTPGNTLIGADGRISVTDFGALTALQASAPLKKSFGSRGRSSYRAPELNNGGAPTIASDIYALGAITYELLTLREASLGNSAVSTRSERLPPPSRLVRRLHSRIDPVIMRALENAPARRHKSCADFAEGLREFLVASGGIPPREDLQKFVGELFPNEVQVSISTQVPIERAFELTDISGVGVIEADDVEADERQSFSGGKVDDRTPTSDGLPVFGAADTLPPESASTDPEQPSVRDTIKTEPEAKAVERRAPTEWDAPAAAVPEAHAGPTPQQSSGYLKNRVRVVEDFAVLDDAPKAPPPRAPKEKPAKTIMTFAVPFKRDGDPVIPNFEEIRQRSARQARVVSFFAAMILMITVGWAVFKFVDGSPDPVGEIVAYLPAPIAREINARRPPPKPAFLPPIPGKKLKLAEFDKLHPDKAFNPTPDGAPPEPKEPARPEPPPPQIVKPVPLPQPKPVVASTNCYQASGKGLSALSVRSSGQVRVEIDGKKVCGSASKIAVTSGTHRVEITDIKTKREYTSSNRFEPGKTLTITPIFPNR
ncbi:MAG: serine/threonine protein kinase [Archangium sp.]